MSCLPRRCWNYVIPPPEGCVPQANHSFLCSLISNLDLHGSYMWLRSYQHRSLGSEQPSACYGGCLQEPQKRSLHQIQRTLPNPLSILFQITNTVSYTPTHNTLLCAYVYLCICASIYIYIHTRTYTHLHTTCVYMYVYVYVHVYSMYVYVNISVQTNISISVCIPNLILCPIPVVVALPAGRRQGPRRRPPPLGRGPQTCLKDRGRFRVVTRPA